MIERFRRWWGKLHPDIRVIPELILVGIVFTPAMILLLIFMGAWR